MPPPVGWADVATKRDLDALEQRMDLRFEVVENKLLAAFRGELLARSTAPSAQTRTQILADPPSPQAWDDGAMSIWQDDSDEGRAPICPYCGVTTLPAELSHVLDTDFYCDNADCDAYGERIEP